MESLTQKRARLRDELQDAYSAWLVSTRGASEFDGIDVARVDVSGCPDANKAEWFAYQSAKARLVVAYAEGAETAPGRGRTFDLAA